MNNVIISLKRFIKNKNTVTLIGIILIMIVLYWGYNRQIQQAVKEVSIPVAKVTIQPRTQITKDMIEYVSIPSIAVKNNVIRNSSTIIGKYTNVNSVIPAGSMFFSSVLINKEELPDSAFVEVKDGEIVYNFPVNMASTYGNSIFPGQMVDIYMKAVDDDKKIMVGRLLENVKILAVRDSQGKNVFENTDDNRTPAYLIFGVEEEIHILLRKASYMGNGVVLFPVPHGGVGTSEGETQVSTQYLKDFINSHTVVIEDTNNNNNFNDNVIDDNKEE